MEFLRGVGSGIQNAASRVGGALDAPNAPNEPSVLGLLAQQPEHILRGLIQAPASVIDYGLARFAEPGVENAYRNMVSSGLLANLYQTDAGRSGLVNVPRVAQLAGVAPSSEAGLPERRYSPQELADLARAQEAASQAQMNAMFLDPAYRKNLIITGWNPRTGVTFGLPPEPVKVPAPGAGDLPAITPGPTLPPPPPLDRRAPGDRDLRNRPGGGPGPGGVQLRDNPLINSNPGDRVMIQGLNGRPIPGTVRQDRQGVDTASGIWDWDNDTGTFTPRQTTPTTPPPTSTTLPARTTTPTTRPPTPTTSTTVPPPTTTPTTLPPTVGQGTGAAAGSALGYQLGPLRPGAGTVTPPTAPGPGPAPDYLLNAPALGPLPSAPPGQPQPPATTPPATTPAPGAPPAPSGRVGYPSAAFAEEVPSTTPSTFVGAPGAPQPQLTQVAQVTPTTEPGRMVTHPGEVLGGGGPPSTAQTPRGEAGAGEVQQPTQVSTDLLTNYKDALAHDEDLRRYVEQRGFRTNQEALNDHNVISHVQAYTRQQQIDLHAAEAEMTERARAMTRALPAEDKTVIAGMLKSRRLLTQISNEFSPDELRQFTGNYRNLVMRGRQSVADNLGIGAVNPRFSKFQSMVAQLKSAMFDMAGKQLTGMEREVVEQYIPTGEEGGGATDFVQKARSFMASAMNGIDERLRLRGAGEEVTQALRDEFTHDPTMGTQIGTLFPDFERTTPPPESYAPRPFLQGLRERAGGVAGTVADTRPLPSAREIIRNPPDIDPSRTLQRAADVPVHAAGAATEAVTGSRTLGDVAEPIARYGPLAIAGYRLLAGVPQAVRSIRRAATGAQAEGEALTESLRGRPRTPERTTARAVSLNNFETALRQAERLDDPAQQYRLIRDALIDVRRAHPDLTRHFGTPSVRAPDLPPAAGIYRQLEEALHAMHQGLRDIPRLEGNRRLIGRVVAGGVGIGTVLSLGRALIDRFTGQQPH